MTRLVNPMVENILVHGATLIYLCTSEKSMFSK